MKPYKPSNITPISGYQWLILSTIITGGVVGGIVSFIGNFLYLIVLFPFGMGLLGGYGTHIAVKQGKVRNPILAGVFGAFTALSIYGGMQGFDYLNFQRIVGRDFREGYSEELQNALAASNGEVTEEELVQLAIDTILIEDTGRDGFMGYLQFSAQHGMELSRSSSDGIPVNGIGMWIYRGVELLIIGIISTAGGLRAAKQPFCETSDRWYEDPQRIGNVSDERSEEFIGFLDRNNYLKAGELINTQVDIPIPSIEVYVQLPPEDGTADSIVQLHKTSLDKNKKLQLEEMSIGMVSPREMKQLQDAIPKPVETPETVETETNDPVSDA